MPPLTRILWNYREASRMKCHHVFFSIFSPQSYINYTELPWKFYCFTLMFGYPIYKNTRLLSIKILSIWSNNHFKLHFPLPPTMADDYREPPFWKWPRSLGQRSVREPAPRGGGLYCTGDRVIYQSCSTAQLLQAGTNFTQKCQAFNGL